MHPVLQKMKLTGACIAALACFLACSSESKAAIFRLQSSADDNGTPPTYNYGKLTFSANSINYEVTGEFRIETDYLNTSGNTVTGSGAIQAWNLNITSGGTNYRYTNGYTSAVMGGLTNTSTGTADVDKFTLNCTDGDCGGNGGSVTFDFLNLFNSRIGNSLNTGLPIENTIQSVSLKIGADGTTFTDNAPAGQADFVPFAPGMFLVLPVASLLLKLRTAKPLS